MAQAWCRRTRLGGLLGAGVPALCGVPVWVDIRREAGDLAVSETSPSFPLEVKPRLTEPGCLKGP